jgi:hypothetical protein
MGAAGFAAATTPAFIEHMGCYKEYCELSSRGMHDALTNSGFVAAIDELIADTCSDKTDDDS